MAPPRLTSERIVEAAFAIVEQEGLEALSMRRLAEALDVWPMAVYRYFRDKDELLDALADQGVLVEPPDDAGGWQDRLRELLVAAAATLARHPPALRARFLGPPPSAGALRLERTGIDILAAAGFDERLARRGWRALLAYAVGSASLAPDEEASRFGLELLLEALERARARPA